MMKLATSCLTVLVSLCVVSPLRADIILSGDTNITNALTGSYSGSIDEGNQQFFINVLQGGSNVAILQGIIGSPSVASAAMDVNNFYNSLSGVSSTIISGAITSLSGYDLLFVPLLLDAFTSSEISVFHGFLARGGSIFFTGENEGYLTQNDYINSALTALGSSMLISSTLFDLDFHTATGSQIATDPYTAGVNSFTYAAPSQVTGGTILFYGTGGQPFVSYETITPIPEPTSLLLLGTGLAAIGLATWRRRK